MIFGNFINIFLSLGEIFRVVFKLDEGVKVICKLMVFFFSFGINFVLSWGSIILVVIIIIVVILIIIFLCKIVYDSFLWYFVFKGFNIMFFCGFMFFLNRYVVNVGIIISVINIVESMVNIILIVIGWNNFVLMFLKLNKGMNIIRIMVVVKKIGRVIFLFVFCNCKVILCVLWDEFNGLLFLICLFNCFLWLCLVLVWVKCLNMFLIIIIELFISMLIVIVMFLSDIRLVESLNYDMIIKVILIEIGIEIRIKNVVCRFIKNKVRIIIINMNVNISVFIIVFMVWVIKLVWL